MGSHAPTSQNRAMPHITGGPSGDSKLLHDPPKKLMLMLILEILQTETDKHVIVKAHVNERAMWQFAKNFAPDVLTLEPKRLADQVREEAERTVAAYRETEQ